MREVPVLTRKAYFRDDGFPLTLVRAGGSTQEAGTERVALHAHEFKELVIILSGCGLHVTERETWPLAAGDVFVILNGQAHGYADSEHLRLINVLYDDEILVPAHSELHHLPGYRALFTLEPSVRQQRGKGYRNRLRLSLAERTHAEQMLQGLEEELRARAPGFTIMARSLFLQLVTFLSRCYSHSLVPVSRRLLRIAEVIDFMESHGEHDLYIEQLAAMAHMSRRHFLRVFREATGQTPMAYLISLRITRGAELLRQGQLNITETAFRVGFQDSNYFSRQFRRVFGMSPREFMRRQRVFSGISPAIRPPTAAANRLR